MNNNEDFEPNEERRIDKVFSFIGDMFSNVINKAINLVKKDK